MEGKGFGPHGEAPQGFSFAPPEPPASPGLHRAWGTLGGREVWGWKRVGEDGEGEGREVMQKWRG